MRSEDYRAFSDMLNGCAELLQRSSQEPLTAEAKTIFFRALATYSLEAVRAAFDAHVKDPQRGRFFPTPADLIAQIERRVADDGRPGADEAWATALRGEDQDTTIVWTQEIAEAMGVARPLLRLGDKVGARFAFREAYERLVQAAREAGKPVDWSASLGFDPEQRERAVEAAVTAGQLQHTARLALPGPSGKTLLSLADLAPTDELRTRLRAAIDTMKARPDMPYVPNPNVVRTNQLKHEALLKARAYAAEQGIELDGSPIGAGALEAR